MFVLFIFKGVPHLIFILGSQLLFFCEVVYYGGEGYWFEVVDGEVAGEFVVGDVDSMLFFDDEVDDFLPPADHLHLFFWEVKADIVVDEF